MLPNLPPDWAKLELDDVATVEAARLAAAAMINGGDAARPGLPGLVMRGMMLAIADQYGHSPRPHAAAHQFQTGLESTIRGVRNAFGQVWMERERG